MIKKIVKLFLVLLWMVLIFSFSAQNAHQSGSMSNGFIVKFAELLIPGNLTEIEQQIVISHFSFIVRKTAHFTVYLILGILVLSFLKEFSIKHIVIAAVIICCLYSISDEYHQTFVPGRSGEVRDVCIDTSGAFIGISLGELVTNIIRKKKTE